jgi:hypothetical protein
MATKIQASKQTNQLKTIPANEQTHTQNVKYNLAL